MAEKISELDKVSKNLASLCESSRDEEIKKILGSASRDLQAVIERRSPANYLLLPETKDHPELVTNLTRLSYGPEVQKIAEKLGLKLKNNDQGYLGNINFKKAQDIAKGLEGVVESPLLFVEKLRILKSGKGYDKEGTKQDPKRLEQAFNEITEVRNPWRFQWLDHQYFLDKERRLQVTYHRFVDGKIKEVTEPLDPETLMENRKPGIDLVDYINNPTSQGLPRKSVKEGSLYFSHSRNCAVARFLAYADGSDLGGYGDPGCSDSGGGVAVAKIFHRK